MFGDVHSMAAKNGLIHFLLLLFYHQDQLLEALLNILPCFGTHLHIFHIKASAQILCFHPSYFSLHFQVAFCTHQYFYHSLLCDIINLFHPSRNVLKRMNIYNWESHYYASCSLIEGVGNVLESLLAGCVPNLESQGEIVEYKFFDLKVNADGGHIAILVWVGAITSNQICFPHSAVSDHQYFQYQVRLTLPPTAH